MSSILLDIHLAYHALDRLLARELDGVGVSVSEALVLRLLTLNPRVTVAAIRDSTGLPASTVTSLVARLVERRLARTHRLDSDRRWVVVRPTLVGKGAALLADAALREIERRVRDLPNASLAPDVSELAESLNVLDRPRPLSRLD